MLSKINEESSESGQPSHIKKRSILDFNQRKSSISAVIAFVIRMSGVGAGFLVSLLVAHRFGAEASGIYGLVTQTALILAMLANGGIEIALVKQFAPAVADRAGPSGVLVAQIALASFAALAGWSLIGWATLAIFPTSSLGLLALYALPIAIIAAARAINRISTALLRAARQFSRAQIGELLVTPVCILIALMAIPIGELPDLVTATVWANIIATVLSVTFAVTTFRLLRRAPRLDPRALARDTWPQWIIGVLLLGVDWVALAVIAALADLGTTGNYRLAAQIAFVLAIFALGVSVTFMPRYSVAIAQDRWDEVAKLGRRAMVISFAAIAPATFIILMLATKLPEVFGPEFEAAPALLAILATGQLASSTLAPGSAIIALTESRNSNVAITVATSSIALALTPVFMLAAGTMGVAIWITFIASARALIYIRFLYVRYRIDLFRGKLSEDRRTDDPRLPRVDA